jgi:tetratricopeptide (TPR) repeat protein
MQRYLPAKLLAIIIILIAGSAAFSNEHSQKSSTSAAGERKSLLKQLDNLTTEAAFSKAKELVATLVEKYPSDVEVTLAAARFYRKVNAPQLASAQYQKLVTLKPSLSEPYIALAQIALTDLQVSRALDYARKAIAIDPNQKEAQIALVNALIDSDQPKEADKELSRLLSAPGSSSDPTINYLAAKLNREKGQLAFAMSFLDQAISLKPDETDWLLDKANLCESLGDFAQTKDVLNKLLNIDPHSIDALNKLAQVLEFYFHDFDGAIDKYQKILVLNPDFVEAETGIDRCTAKKNDLAGQMKRQILQRLK